MKILYLSCHSILEYDELSLFHELGHDFFSIGGYINPRNPHDPKRPPIDHDYHEHLASVAMVHNQNNLHREQVEWADVVIVSHIPEWVQNNWQLFKELKKRVIWRSIGQSVAGIEARLKSYRDDGLEIVRYSPFESRIPGYIGADAVIRFYKDPEEFKDWQGDSNEVITFAQGMRSRGEFCNYEFFKSSIEGIADARIYGPNNDDVGDLGGGMLKYDQLKEKLRHAGVYVYTGTWPASYTLNFIEAWMTGIPVVAIGPRLGNSPIFGQDTYEVSELIKNGLHGFVSDDPEQAQIFIKKLLEDKNLAAETGRQGRLKAIEIFGKDIIKKQWQEYLINGPKKHD